MEEEDDMWSHHEGGMIIVGIFWSIRGFQVLRVLNTYKMLYFNF